MSHEFTDEHVGRKVVYRCCGQGEAEEGVVTSMNDRFVFVRYGTDQHSKATPPEKLRLVSDV